MTDPTNLPPTGGDLGPITPPTGSAYQAPSMPDITDLVEGSKGRTDAKPAGGGGGGGLPRGVIIGGVVGAVTAVSASSITVNTRAGSVTVAVPGTTTVNKTVQGSMSDVKVGDNVTVASTTDANGNRTASTITIVPAGSGGGFGPGPQPTGGNA